MNTAMPFGYRIVGPCSRERKVVQYDRAFAAYAACDDLAQIDSEGFLSPFQYDNEILTRRIDAAGTLDVRGFDGRCWSRFIWFDIDREGDIDSATQDARRLAMMLVERYRIDESELLLFFSGSKGFHIGLPTSLFGSGPSIEFGVITRKLADELASLVRVVIDPSVYGKVQPLRAPNSRHGKTGRHKRILTFDELMHRKPSSIVMASAEPLEFDLPTEPDIDQRAADDWHAAVAAMKRKAEAVKVIAADRSELNRSTFDVIAGDAESPRRSAVYSAAANLAEFGCSLRLALALLTPGGLDSGLPPTDVRRAIENGIKKGGAV